MSSPNRRLIVAASARKDVRGILLYTLQQWGAIQRTRYKSEIDAAFSLIIDHPFIGMSRNELALRYDLGKLAGKVSTSFTIELSL